MRIGIITDETDTQLVGFGTYTLELTKNILLLDRKNEYYLIHRKKEEHEIYKMGAKEIIVPYNQRFPFSTIRNFIILPLKLRKYNLDVVHHMTITGPFVFKPLIKGKSIETIHELLAIAYPKCFELPVKLALRMLLPRIARNVDYIFTASKHWKAEIIKRYKIPQEKIGVIFPGSNPAFKPLNRKKCAEKLRKEYGITKPYMLFVSTLEAKKNIPTLLKAYKKLREKGIKHKLVLVGRKGYGYGKIEEAIRELKLEKDIVMPGYVPSGDLPAFYNAAEAFVFPAYDAGNMTIVDAMKCGCPLITSNGGSAPEMVGKAAITVDVHDADGYARAMEKVAMNRKLAESMRKKSLKEAEKFSWKESAKQTIAVYEKLCSGSL